MKEKEAKKIKPIYWHLIFISLLFIFLTGYFHEIAFEGFVPHASDTSQWRASAQSILEYNKTHKNQALWNSNLFAGMPGYLTYFKKKIPFIDNFRKITDHIVNWRILFLFFGGLGVYILMIYLSIEPFIAFIGAISFALSSHFLGLIDIGHNTKIRAIMYLPWITFSLFLLKKHKNLFGIGLISVFLIGQMRENHPQISYYTIIMIGIFWTIELYYAVKNKELKDFSVFSAMLLFGGFISLIAVANPYLSIREYAKYSMRGVHGLATSYATSWSFAPLEILSFFVPGFYGGISPYYWGWMPFTQTYMYFGIMILILAIFSYKMWNDNFVKFLLISVFISLILSFGRHFSLLTNFMLHYFPGYNKFRVPATILVILQSSVVVLSGYGLTSLIKNKGNKNLIKLVRNFLIFAVLIFILFLMGQSVFGNLSFIKDGEKARYSISQLKQLKQMRLDILIKSGLTSFFIAIIGLSSILAFLKNRLNKTVLLTVLTIIIVFDLINTDKNYFQNLVPKATIENQFTANSTDKFLLNDHNLFRIYPLGQGFGQNKWSYFHQSIGGYHGAKLQRYQDIYDHCLFYKLDPGIPINWNLLNILNTKYIIFNNSLSLDKLQYAFYDENTKNTVYKIKNNFPRAWFVDNIKLIKEKEKIWDEIDSAYFNPAKTAIVEENIVGIEKPDSAKVKIVSWDSEHFKIDVSTNKKAFLNISEIYYPAGWNAYLDGKKIKIYASDYIIRGVVIPKGHHILEMKFEPKSYSLSIKMSLIGILISLFLLIIGGYIFYKKNYSGKIIYVIQ
jgi:hypothetical protein